MRRGKLPEPAEVQEALAGAGVPLVWFDDVSPSHPAFQAIHTAAIRGIYPLGAADLHASPNVPATRGEAARALTALFREKLPDSVPKRLDVPTSHPHAGPISRAIEKGWMATDHRNWFHPDLPFYWRDWREAQFPHPIAPPPLNRSGPVTRAELAQRLISR
jgi:hypothetical protein